MNLLELPTQAIQKLRDAGLESITNVRYLEDSDLQSLRFVLPTMRHPNERPFVNSA